jgi:hypothetical protein
MVNTNGLRLANEDGFAERLAAYQPGFELYLQWDSLDDRVLRELRGADLAATRRRAIERLNAADLSTTLVVTLKKVSTMARSATFLRFAVEQPCVRGVTFQPIQHAGRAENFDPARDRLTLSEVRRRILEQFPLFSPDDVVPVPCNPDCLAMAYALKLGGELLPLTASCRRRCSSRAGRNASWSSASRRSASRSSSCSRPTTRRRARPGVCTICSAACRRSRPRTSPTRTSSAC